MIEEQELLVEAKEINYDVGTPVLPGGREDAYQAVLANIPVVIEEQLSWDQVLAFRQDPEARRKFPLRLAKHRPGR